MANSATMFGPQDAGAVVVCGSYGGVYPAYLAAVAAVKAVIFSDAGCGLNGAAIAGLDVLQDLGIAAATVSHLSAQIGNANDMRERGIASHVNKAAAAVGCAEGQTCAELVALLQNAEHVRADPPAYREARVEIATRPIPLRLLDSISMVGPDDVGTIVISGSHGGLIGATRTAVKENVFAAVYHDAGGGIDDAGFARLPALDTLGIIGATVDGMTAEIGNARSMLRTGRVSRVNGLGQAAGIQAGMLVLDMAAMLGASDIAQVMTELDEA